MQAQFHCYQNQNGQKTALKSKQRLCCVTAKSLMAPRAALPALTMAPGPSCGCRRVAAVVPAARRGLSHRQRKPSPPQHPRLPAPAARGRLGTSHPCGSSAGIPAERGRLPGLPLLGKEREVSILLHWEQGNSLLINPSPSLMYWCCCSSQRAGELGRE